MNSPHFKLSLDKAGKFSISFVCPGRSDPAFSATGFHSRAQALDALEQLRRSIPNAPLVNATNVYA